MRWHLLAIYNIYRKEDCIEGVPDTGTSRFPDLADHACVFMLKGVYKQWKQPLSTFSSGPVKALVLKTLIKE